VAATGDDHVSGPSAVGVGARPRRRDGAGAGRRTDPLVRGLQLATTLGMLVLWDLLSRSGLVSSEALSPPVDVFTELVRLVGESGYWQAVLDTTVAWGSGLAITIAVAVPLGFFICASSFAFRSSRLLIDLLRTIPPVTIVPLAVLIYGSSLRMQLLLIVYGALWPLLLQVAYGVHQVDPQVRDMAKAFRLGRWLRVTRIILPSAAPFIATGLRLAATWSLLLAIGAEAIGGAPGVGEEILTLQEQSALPEMYAYVVTAALMGVLLNVVLARMERSALKWHPSQRGKRP